MKVGKEHMKNTKIYGSVERNRPRNLQALVKQGEIFKI